MEFNYDNTKGIPASAILAAAIAAHTSNAAYCHSIGDASQLPWEEAPDWQKESALKGVLFIIENPTSGPEQSHESWLKEKEATGWKYGPVKNPETKEHPCFVPYNELPFEQRVKDAIFQSVVRAMLSGFGIKDQSHHFINEYNTTRVQAVKSLRQQLDVVLGYMQLVASSNPHMPKQHPSRELSLAITKVEEGIMWLGKELGSMREPHPYPESRNPNSEKIEATADGLKNH